MTHPHQYSATNLEKLMRNLRIGLVVAIIAFGFFATAFWHIMSTRITAIETRLAKMSEAIERRLAEHNTRSELQRAVKDLETRIDERLKLNSQRFVADHETMHARASVTDPGNRAATETRARPAAQASISVSDQKRVAEPFFKEALHSLYRSLNLSPERRAELGTGLEDLLDSIWPEYVAFMKSPNADKTALQKQYCTKAQTILTPKELERLGCY